MKVYDEDIPVFGDSLSEGFDTPVVLRAGETMAGRVHSSSDGDYIGLQLTAGQSYLVELDVTRPSGDFNLRWFDSTQTFAGWGEEESFGNDWWLILVPQVSGTYYVAVDGGSPFQTGPYTLSLSDFSLPDGRDGGLVDTLLRGYWQGFDEAPPRLPLGADRVLTYNAMALDSTAQGMVHSALALWSNIANIGFAAATTDAAQIVFGDDMQGAFTDFDDFRAGTGPVQINISADWLARNGANYTFSTFVHEIGHALGLGHPGIYNFEESSDPIAFHTHADWQTDSVQRTIMSYFYQEENPYDPLENATPLTPMVDDIAAIQQIWGRPADNSGPTGGNTVWGYDSTISGALGISIADFMVAVDDRRAPDGDGMTLTIYDTGGTDTLNLADYFGSAQIDLTPGALSFIGTYQITVATDISTWIENAVGTAQGDVIRGNARANTLTAGAGNDSVLGGSGADSLLGGAGHDTLYGGAGADLLQGDVGSDHLVAGTADAGFDAAAGAVRRLYLATLDREPDLAGHRDWTGRLAGGLPLDQIVTGFTASREFELRYGATTDSDFVTLLYDNVLDRAPDAPGLADWTGRLAGGQSRESVVLGFSESAEFQRNTDADLPILSRSDHQMRWSDEVWRLYQATLARAPDGDGLADWAGRLASGATLQQVADGFLGSPEFTAAYGGLGNTGFVTLLYRNILGRDPAPGEGDTWITRLDSAVLTRRDVVLGFSESAEFKAASRPDMITDLRATLGDVLDGGAGDDRLFGGVGSDTFRFRADQAGADRIGGFEGWDVIALQGFGLADGAAAAAAFVQDGDDALFSAGDVSLRIVGWQATALTADNFEVGALG